MRLAWGVILLSGVVIGPLTGWVRADQTAASTGELASTQATEPSDTDIANPTTQPTAIDPVLEAQLKALDKKNSTVVDITAKFEQRRYTDLSPRPFESMGTLRAMNSIARWDTTTPKPSVMIITPTQVQMYYPTENLLEEYPVDPKMMDMMSTPFPQLAVYRRHFSIFRATPQAMEDKDPAHNSDLVLQLMPFDPVWAEHVQTILVRVNLKTGMTEAMRTVDSDRLPTDLLFSDIKVNTGLVADSLKLIVPPGTQVSHPLGSKPDNSPAGGQ